MAGFIPQSLNILTKFGAIPAIATKPYSGGDRNLATNMTPTVDVTVEVIKPQKRLNPPFAETFAILFALVTQAVPDYKVFHIILSL